MLLPVVSACSTHVVTLTFCIAFATTRFTRAPACLGRVSGEWLICADAGICYWDLAFDRKAIEHLTLQPQREVWT
jgi:hypothetical protein